MPRPPIRVLLADDHAILREGLALLIANQADMEIAAQATDGVEAVQLACAMKPDVAVLDVSMPRLGGAEAAEQIREQCPGVRILALTRHSETGYLRRLLTAGASGYVLKKSAADDLIAAIRIVAAGGTYLEPQLAGSLMPHSAAHPDSSEGRLSAREEEILRSIAWGRSNKEIAAELQISVKTVESYRATAIEKLSLHSRADIVRYAVGRGWLSVDASPE